MILVDSSVLFDHTRGRDPRLAHHFKTLPVAVAGIVRAEVLHGARNTRDRAALLAFLNLFAQVPTPESARDLLGDNLCALRMRGVNVPLADALLASLAITQGVGPLRTHPGRFARPPAVRRATVIDCPGPRAEVPAE